MKKYLTVLLSVTALVCALSACTDSAETGSVPVADTTTSSSTSPSSSSSSSSHYVPPVAPAPAPESSSDGGMDQSIQKMAMDMSWDKMSDEQHAQICLGIAVNHDAMIDAFMASAGESFDRDLVEAYFEDVCP